MRPKTQDAATLELFQAHFSQILNREHPLLRLAQAIDWARFEAAFADSYCEELGAPGKAMRLMVGLQYLKFTFNESDESLVERWIENPYWQCFCGFTHMQHEPPIDPSSMSRWRKRVGAERLELLIKETIDLALCEKQLPKRDLAKITVDTTVQEKNITYPTDSKLLYSAIRKLVAPGPEKAWFRGWKSKVRRVPKIDTPLLRMLVIGRIGARRRGVECRSGAFKVANIAKFWSFRWQP